VVKVQGGYESGGRAGRCTRVQIGNVSSRGGRGEHGMKSASEERGRGVYIFLILTREACDGIEITLQVE